MQIQGAAHFLYEYGSRFAHDSVRAWVWEPDDNDFGKLAEWAVNQNSVVEATATVDLQAGQLQLTITERDLTDGGASTSPIFTALISFDDRTVTVDGVPMEFSDNAIRNVIDQFNERA